mmetsp:Transcript_33340/g.51095  ORF Transcript_33340/g.51095 Transcript_33340/m.51095 type:complete len:301 (-) Transcript_33340:465-1367(-)
METIDSVLRVGPLGIVLRRARLVGAYLVGILHVHVALLDLVLLSPDCLSIVQALRVRRSHLGPVLLLGRHHGHASPVACGHLGLSCSIHGLFLGWLLLLLLHNSGRALLSVLVYGITSMLDDRAILLRLDNALRLPINILEDLLRASVAGVVTHAHVAHELVLELGVSLEVPLARAQVLTVILLRVVGVLHHLGTEVPSGGTARHEAVHFFLDVFALHEGVLALLRVSVLRLLRGSHPVLVAAIVIGLSKLLAALHVLLSVLELPLVLVTDHSEATHGMLLLLALGRHIGDLRDFLGLRV